MLSTSSHIKRANTLNINNKPCPCHSGEKYKKCCRTYHQGELAPTPEALLRSRYAAYALGLADYVIATTHPDNESASRDVARWRQELALFAKGTRFLGLELLEQSRAEDDQHGWLTFVATLEQRGQDASFRERSRFTRQGERWLYEEAESYEELGEEPAAENPSNNSEIQTS